MEIGIAYGVSYADVVRGLQDELIYLNPPENTDSENNQPELATKMSTQNGWLRCSWEGKAYTYVYDSSKGWSYKKKPDEDYMKPAEGIGTDDLSDKVLGMIEKAGESGFELPDYQNVAPGNVLGVIEGKNDTRYLEWKEVNEVPDFDVETPMGACLRATGKSGTITPSIVEWQPVREVPESTSTDEGKVLTVDSRGGAAWEEVNEVPDSTSQDEGKVLTVDSNGDAVWGESSGNSTIMLRMNSVAGQRGAILYLDTLEAANARDIQAHILNGGTVILYEYGTNNQGEARSVTPFYLSYDAAPYGDNIQFVSIRTVGSDPVGIEVVRIKWYLGSSQYDYTYNSISFGS